MDRRDVSQISQGAADGGEEVVAGTDNDGGSRIGEGAGEPVTTGDSGVDYDQRTARERVGAAQARPGQRLERRYRQKLPLLEPLGVLQLVRRDPSPPADR